MASKKKVKSAAYQWSGDIRRIIPLAGGNARLTDELGKSTHYSRDSVEFRDECVRLDDIMDGKIANELNDLGWSLCDPGWELSFGEDFAATLGENNE